MPAIAIHTRSPSGFTIEHQQLSPQQTSQSHSDHNQGDMARTPGESGKKRLGFLRHLRPGHRSQSSISIPKSPDTDGPVSPTPIHRATAPIESQSRSRLAAPFRKDRSRSLSPGTADVSPYSKDVSRYDSGVANDKDRPSMTFERPLSNGSIVSNTPSSYNDNRAQSPFDKRSVKWASGVNGEEENQPQRPRRLSASSSSRRKSSIYVRLSEGGGYQEGVDRGAGSKARRLSVQLPAELSVDEDRLEDYFDLLSRLGKKKIGEGGAASVQLMKSKKAGDDQHKVFAVKEFRTRDSEEEQELEYQRKIKSEYAIAKSCQHPNIVHTFRLCCSGEEWFHVMEYCDLGDLNDLINKSFMTQEDRNCMFKQLIRGVEYLHARGISHRDIKSENILVTHHGCLKIADFGTSEVFCGEHPGLRNCRRPSIIGDESEIRLCAPGMVGSMPYMAPEVVDRKVSYDPRGVDVWSCAIVYLSLCFTGTPWEYASPESKNYNIYCSSWDDFMERNPDGIISRDGPLPSFAASPMLKLTTPNSRTMIMGMLHPDPKLRWSIKQVLELISEREGYGPWPCCQQDGYSDDIKLRERKARHNHIPPDKRKKNGEFSGKT